MDTVDIGGHEVSRFILGSNPFSGFSHQGHQMDRRMVHYWTTARIKEALREAESLGINTLLGRADHHIMRVLIEYWDEGGTIQWIGQTCPELGPPEPSLKRLTRVGAEIGYVHGGYADHLLAQGRIEELTPTVEFARELGLSVGLAGHNPDTLRWAEQNLDLDFYMCSYYSPIPREDDPEHQHGAREVYRESDRRAMTKLIQGLSRPAIHYKVMAAGRNDPAEALDYVARHLREEDAVCVGIFTEEKPDMLAEDVRLLQEALRRSAVVGSQ